MKKVFVLETPIKRRRLASKFAKTKQTFACRNQIPRLPKLVSSKLKLMGTVQIPQVVLNSGHKIPAIGFGTGSSPAPPPEEMISILIDAIVAGFRHFDTASFYGNEDVVGRAVAEALESGLVKSRDELFITSKLWCTDAHHDLVLPALHETLRYHNDTHNRPFI